MEGKYCGKGGWIGVGHVETCSGTSVVVIVDGWKAGYFLCVEKVVGLLSVGSDATDG